MKLDTSFNSAFLQLQNGVNNATKAATEVTNAVGSEKVSNVEIASESSNNSADRNGSGGVSVTA